MHVPYLDWAPDLFADEPAARRADSGAPTATASPDGTAAMWQTLAQAWTAGATRPSADGHLAKAA